MAYKVFLDANILLDYTLKRGSYQDAENLLVMVAQKQVAAFITTSVLHITGHWVSKAYGSVTTKDLLITF